MDDDRRTEPAQSSDLINDDPISAAIRGDAAEYRQRVDRGEPRPEDFPHRYPLRQSTVCAFHIGLPGERCRRCAYPVEAHDSEENHIPRMGHCRICDQDETGWCTFADPPEARLCAQCAKEQS